MSPKLPFIVILAICVLSRSLALSLDPNYIPPPEPTPAQMWADSTVIVYGKIRRLEMETTDDDNTRYNATLHIEHCWKGDQTGDIRIEGPADTWDGPRAPFRIRQNYLLFLEHSTNGKLGLRHQVEHLSYPLKSSPRTNLDNLFGELSYNQSDYRKFEIMEFLERTTGNFTEADRLLELMKPQRLEVENRLIAEQKEKALAFLDAARTELARAREQRDVATRKALLEKLQSRLPSENNDEGIKVLKNEITAELSIVETYSSNGIKTFPLSTALPAP